MNTGDMTFVQVIFVYIGK